MFLVKVPCINFCYASSGSGLKGMNSNFRSIRITPPGQSKLPPLTLGRTRTRTRTSISISISLLNRGRGADSNSCRAYASHQLPQIGKVAPAVVTLIRNVFEKLLPVLSPLVLMIDTAMFCVTGWERVEAISIDEWLSIRLNLSNLVFLIAGVLCATNSLRKIPFWRFGAIILAANVGEFYAHKHRCGTFLRVLRLFRSGKEAEQEHKGIASEVSLEEMQDGWSVSVREIPMQILDLNKVPLILKDVEGLMETDDIFLAKEPPYCRPSVLAPSYAELTLGCYMKPMSKDLALIEWNKRMAMYTEVIEKHGGVLWRKWQARL